MRCWLASLCLAVALTASGYAQAAAPYINATDPPFNILPDGQTPMDAQLAFAVSACGSAGNPRTLRLPAGLILLSGTQSINLKDCRIVGQGIIGVTNGDPASFGTTILLASPTTTPFIIGSNWSIEGINFYWPQQTNGTTAYPPLFADDGSHQANLVTLSNVNIINAYDGFTETLALGWSDWHISNSYMYAVHDLFTLDSIGDSWRMSDVHFTPGPWLSLCNFTCTAAVNAGDQVNTIFHIDGNANSAGVLMNAGPLTAFAWRWGFKVDALGVLGGYYSIAFDGTGTILDSSSGGNTPNTVLSGAGNTAGIPIYNGGAVSSNNNDPMFNLGANSYLILDNFEIGQAQGSFITTAGESVYLNGVIADSYGKKNDTNDYYGVVLTGSSGGTEIVVRNSRFTAEPNTHTHGITNQVAATEIVAENNQFELLNDDLNILTTGSGPIIVTGNVGIATQGSASVLTTGAGAILYANNSFDKPPNASVSNCGTRPTVTGGLSGFIGVGSGASVTSCTLTLPWQPFGGGGGACTFTPSIAVALGATVSGTPPVWTIHSSANMAGGQIFYNCPGRQ